MQRKITNHSCRLAYSNTQ